MNNKLSNEEMEELAMSEAAIGTAWDAIDEYLQDMSRRVRAYNQNHQLNWWFEQAL